jgi:hypothetical protein
MFFSPLHSTESKAMIVDCERQPTESLAPKGVPLEILCDGNPLLPVFVTLQPREAETSLGSW